MPTVRVQPMTIECGQGGGTLTVLREDEVIVIKRSTICQAAKLPPDAFIDRLTRRSVNIELILTAGHKILFCGLNKIGAAIIWRQLISSDQDIILTETPTEWLIKRVGSVSPATVVTLS